MDPHEWLFGHDTGISSKTIWRQMMGVGGRRSDRVGFPHDPADLGRCIRLLEAFPEWEARMPEMRDHSPEWARLVDHWDELVALYREEVPEHRGMAPKTYHRMQEIIYPEGTP